MNFEKPLILFCLSAAFLTLPLSAEPVRLDYSKPSGQTTTEYDQGLEVVFENVNRLDYTYEITVESLLPQPVAPPALPTSGGIPSGAAALAAPMTDDERKKLEACLGSINTALIERLRTFGESDLEGWKTSSLDGLATAGCDSGTVQQIRSLLTPQPSVSNPGELNVTQAVGSAVAATGPGGKVIITIKATPKLIQTAGESASGLIAQRIEGTALETVLAMPANGVTKTKVEEHKVDRKFTISFEPPEGILFSFGPYISQLERREFARIANPAHDPMDDSSNEFMIGLSEDSDQSFGVAAYWSVLVWQMEWAGIGFSWGIAYDAQNEIDEAVQGLVSLAFEFEKAPLLLHIGAAVGRQTRLVDGFELMDPIEANQEIPLTTGTEIELYLGISFRFGRR